ncbi:MULTISPECIES: heavy-metal-associated domain-containing protein [Dethiosulfovibrio]|jgi:copper chaperone CopZ|uniref:Heavy-metal-associated domain-containing protein n=2 Tax=Dethiosulfovibrio TaxID=47054 RepID=A0ABS9EQN3_9BACT|nr:MULTISPECIES: heavy-metal-associated domain-containing protein [Dethiosulfovibrio]MCF4114518.1 heavy-metal-associated domain-containing protein [Dethiosulfovibrio russensis]MCF4143502.1 heavy-metal-associated domain-containing protein [Dethiosulfovibrio marinus]MCF4146148.1 heavy-metal-associated domain-containing protein [Dethiosulfovibrio acidaminovorans]
MMSHLLKVPDMSCAHCEARITAILEEMKVPSFSVNLSEKTVTIETDDLKRVIEALDDGGYEAEEI